MADTPAPTAMAVGQTDIKATEETVTPAAQTPDPKLEAFARKERQIRKLQQEVAAERTALQAKAKEYETNYIPKSRLSEDPMSVLNEAGVSYDKLTELLLNQPNQNDPTIRMLRAEIKALSDKQENAAKQAEAATTQQYEQAKKQIANEAKMLIDSDPEYETIKAEGLHEAVTELIIETFNKDGYLMDVAEAAKEVENHLVEQGLKMAQYGKVKAKLQPKTEQPVSTPKETKQPQATIKTLTNRVSQEPSNKSSEKAKRERAIAAFYGKLNQ